MTHIPQKVSVFELKIISILRQNKERYSYNSGFLKRSQKLKQCHRPVCILRNISKNYERYIYEQMSNYFGNIFSESQCGFRTGIQCATLSSSHIKKMELKNVWNSPNRYFKSFRLCST